MIILENPKWCELTHQTFRTTLFADTEFPRNDMQGLIIIVRANFNCYTLLDIEAFTSKYIHCHLIYNAQIPHCNSFKWISVLLKQLLLLLLVLTTGDSRIGNFFGRCFYGCIYDKTRKAYTFHETIKGMFL